MENSYIERITVALESIAKSLSNIDDALYCQREDDEYRIADVLEEWKNKVVDNC